MNRTGPGGGRISVPKGTPGRLVVETDANAGCLYVIVGDRAVLAKGVTPQKLCGHSKISANEWGSVTQAHRPDAPTDDRRHRQCQR